MKEKKTYGKKLLENIEKNQGFVFAETREVTLEYGNKIFLPWLEDKVIKNNEYKDWPIVWILVMSKKSINEHIVNVVFGITKKEPIMQLKCLLYSYKPKTDELKVHWMLPQTLQITKAIADFSDGFDPFYAKCCKKYINLLEI